MALPKFAPLSIALERADVAARLARNRQTLGSYNLNTILPIYSPFHKRPNSILLAVRLVRRYPQKPRLTITISL